MCSEIPEIDTLLTEFQAVAQQLDEVLKDLEWRKPDVEGEEKKLAQLKRQAKKDPGVDVATQAIVVRVLREVLNDKIELAEALERRMMILKGQIECISGETEEKGEVGQGGEAVPEET